MFLGRLRPGRLGSRARAERASIPRRRRVHAPRGGRLSAERLLIALGVWVLATALTLAVAAAVVVTLPADYFGRRLHRPRAAPAAGLGLVAYVARNLLGLALILVGVLLSLPGIPGQGILTMLIGLMLVDFPGRRRLERRLVAWPGVLAALNRLRRRFGKPPLVVEPPARPPA